MSSGPTLLGLLLFNSLQYIRYDYCQNCIVKILCGLLLSSPFCIVSERVFAGRTQLKAVEAPHAEVFGWTAILFLVVLAAVILFIDFTSIKRASKKFKHNWKVIQNSWRQSRYTKIESSLVWDLSCLAELINDLVNRQILFEKGIKPVTIQFSLKVSFWPAVNTKSLIQQSNIFWLYLIMLLIWQNWVLYCIWNSSCLNVII